MKKHKWAKEIHAWADGAEIESLYVDDTEWLPQPEPNFNSWYHKFRVKQTNKHQALMDAHKNGAEIEFKLLAEPEEKWAKVENPTWNESCGEYRIKLQPKEPQYLYVYNDGGYAHLSFAKPNKESNYIGKIKLEDEPC